MESKTNDNLILLDKPVDWSSFDVVKKIRSLTRIKKVGHGGTLDPFATGLLILGTGKETKNLSTISNARKTYVATIEFGRTTDSYDITGAETGQAELTGFENLEMSSLLKSFLGESLQLPPMYSAKKVDGKRLYKLARKGIEIERKPHQIVLYDITELRRETYAIEISVECSKGTYIRSLAHDIGIKSGYGAYLKALRRTAIDDFQVEKALTVHDFNDYWKMLN